MTKKNPPFDEKRVFHRIPFDATVLLTNETGKWRSKLIDISLKGVLMENPSEWDGAIGERYDLEILFSNNGALIKMDAAVARLTSDQAGFRCIHIDMDSVAHLRRLIELNLGNPELLNRELSTLG